ncbi:MAG: hypothetical protein ACP5OG_05560 [Candidatus Nanoarchaeia archaeon]
MEILTIIIFVSIFLAVLIAGIIVFHIHKKSYFDIFSIFSRKAMKKTGVFGASAGEKEISGENKYKIDIENYKNNAGKEEKVFKKMDEIPDISQNSGEEQSIPNKGAQEQNIQENQNPGMDLNKKNKRQKKDKKIKKEGVETKDENPFVIEGKNEDKNNKKENDAQSTKTKQEANAEEKTHKEVRVIKLNDKDVQGMLDYLKDKKDFKFSALNTTGFSNEKELKDFVKQTIVDYLNDRLNSIAGNLREFRKKGKDNNLLDVKFMSLKFKIKLFSVTFSKSDLEKVVGIMEFIENGFNEINKLQEQEKTQSV